MDCLEYWKLEEAPFEENADPKFFYESIDHKEALERLRYIIESHNMNIGLLTGEIGAGKTITRNVLREELLQNEEHNLVVCLDTSNYRDIDIIKEILYQLTGSNPENLPNNKYVLITRLKRFLATEVVISAKRVFVFLDEAQKIGPHYLDSIKDLTNISYNYESPITLIFIGQPDLLTKIKKLPQVDQRISMRYHLNRMTRTDTENYIKHRLKRAGLEEDIFSEDAFYLIYSKTDGIPREINRACKIALDYGFSEELNIITKQVMSIIFDDLNRYERRDLG